MTSAPRLVRLLVLATATSLALLVTGTGIAQAHDELAGSSPEAGGTVDAAPGTVELEFSGDVQELGSEVVVTAADGSTVSEGALQVDGRTVTQPLAGDLAGGEYTVDWRVTSADGHPESDSYTFTVSGGTTTDVGEASATTETGSSSTAWIVVAAVVVLAAALAVGLRGLRRRS
jgi:copper resistance protein C